MASYKQNARYNISLEARYDKHYDTFIVGGLGINAGYVKSAVEIKTLPTAPGSVIEFNGCLFTLTGFKTYGGTSIWWPITNASGDQTNGGAIEYYGKDFGDNWTLKLDAGA